MYWVCMSSTCLTYCSYRRCDRDWLPPTWAYTVLASSPTGISKATGFPCLPSLIHILALSVPRLACVQTGVHRRQPSSSTRCSALVLSTNTHTGEDEEGVREKEDSLFYSTHSRHHNTHTHTPHTGKNRNPSIHLFSLRPPASRPLVSVAALHAASPSRDLFSHAAFRTLGSLQRAARTRPPR
jgi:hypothetical protein